MIVSNLYPPNSNRRVDSLTAGRVEKGPIHESNVGAENLDNRLGTPWNHICHLEMALFLKYERLVDCGSARRL